MLSDLLKLMLQNLVKLSLLRISDNLDCKKKIVSEIKVAREELQYRASVINLERSAKHDALRLDSVWLYVRAINEADGIILPASCPYSFEQILDSNFYAGWNESMTSKTRTILDIFEEETAGVFLDELGPQKNIGQFEREKSTLKGVK